MANSTNSRSFDVRATNKKVPAKRATSMPWYDQALLWLFLVVWVAACLVAALWVVHS